MLNQLRQFIFGHAPINPGERLKMSPERLQAAIEAAHAECQAQDAQNRANMRQVRHNRIIIAQGGDFQ